MKILRIAAALLLLAAGASRVSAQDTPKATDPPPISLLKVTVVFSEFDGDKKISSLPYVLSVKAQERRDYSGRIRVGLRVPIHTNKKDSEITYQDIGSNIDCTAQPASDGRFFLDLAVERSSIYSGESTKIEQPSAQASEVHDFEPAIRTFRANYALMMRDGQSSQNTMATDPLNGHVIKIEVTLNVLK